MECPFQVLVTTKYLLPAFSKMDILHKLRYGLVTSPFATGSIPVCSGVGGGVVDRCVLGDVSRGLESPMRGKVPGEMEIHVTLNFGVCV